MKSLENYLESASLDFLKEASKHLKFEIQMADNSLVVGSKSGILAVCALDWELEGLRLDMRIERHGKSTLFKNIKVKPIINPKGLALLIGKEIGDARDRP